MTAEVGTHLPVLLQEVLDALRVRADGIYIDCTFGRGGHSRAILDRLGPDGRLLVIDKDPQAEQAAVQMFKGDGRFEFHRGSFTMLERLAQDRGVEQRVDGILLDLGVSSPQLDDAGRGFSFQQDGPLDMRMDPDTGISAAQWLAEAGEKEISDVLYEYGDERFSRRIARRIVTARDEQQITTTAQLAELVAAAIPRWEKHKHPATRSFQAIRIFINDELKDLRLVLDQALDVLAIGGRLAVISFHSLEDRLVKRFFRDQARGDQYPPELPVPAALLQPRLKRVGKAISAGPAEIDVNVRARSATLRVAERLA